MESRTIKLNFLLLFSLKMCLFFQASLINKCFFEIKGEAHSISSAILVLSFLPPFYVLYIYIICTIYYVESYYQNGVAWVIFNFLGEGYQTGVGDGVEVFLSGRLAHFRNKMFSWFFPRSLIFLSLPYFLALLNVFICLTFHSSPF